MNNVSNEELYNALKTLRDLCGMHPECNECPLYSGMSSDACILSTDGAECPVDWKLVAPDNYYKPFAQS